ncbi:MAG TPA: fibronectin type III domain-containing protein [Patescibacteria group bacterium]|nr:fibronectin type III domain-containing protein [Patescibacteria group bacterium]
MNKIKSLLSILTFLTSILIPQTRVQALASLDQVCSNGVAGNPDVSFLSHEPAQIFVPTKHTLDAISVYLKTEIGGTSRVRAQVLNATTSPGQIITDKTQEVTSTASWVIFDFPDVSMPTGMYAIILSDMDLNGHTVWYHGESACYARGYAAINNIPDLNFDFGFAVYASDPANPQNPAPNTNSNSSNSTNPQYNSQAGTGAAPASQTSSTILPPSKLNAKDVEFDYGGSILLTWFPSKSQNIDGYKLFRSQNSNGPFSEIARTPAMVGGFIDKNATTSITYYYIVRAYKGSLESANSNLASLASSNDLEAIINDYKQSQGLFGGGMLPGAVLAIVVVLGLIFFFVVVMVVGYVIFFRKKSTPTPQPVAATPPPTVIEKEPELKNKTKK